MSATVIESQILHYEVLGRGRPVLLLHSWVGSWRYWIPTMQAASIAYRTYALDLWGFGDSAKVPERYSLEEQSNLIDQFMERMGIGRVALVGHGLGALVALLFAQRYPHLVDRVMAVCAPFEPHAVNDRLTNTPLEALADWLLDRDARFEPVRAEVPKADPLAITATVQATRALNVSALAVHMTTPILFVYGQRDPVIAPPSSEALFTTGPLHLHHIILDDSRHYPMLDEGSKFHRLLNDFLSLPSGESPQQLQLKDEWKRRVR